MDFHKLDSKGHKKKKNRKAELTTSKLHTLCSDIIVVDCYPVPVIKA